MRKIAILFMCFVFAYCSNDEYKSKMQEADRLIKEHNRLKKTRDSLMGLVVQRQATLDSTQRLLQSEIDRITKSRVSE